MLKVIQRFKMLRAFMKLVKDPRKTEQVFSMSTSLRASGNVLTEQTFERLTALPGMQEIFQSHYDPKIPSLAELDRLPEGTFGKAFARHMLTNKLAVDFYPIAREAPLMSFVINRARKSHDFWHVLTGFDTDIPGELGLQGFSYAQTGAPFPVLILLAGLLHVLTRRPEVFAETMNKIIRGYQMGKDSRPLLVWRFEEELGHDLAAIRESLNLHPIDDPKWSRAS